MLCHVVPWRFGHDALQCVFGLSPDVIYSIHPGVVDVSLYLRPGVIAVSPWRYPLTIPWHGYIMSQKPVLKASQKCYIFLCLDY